MPVRTLKRNTVAPLFAHNVAFGVALLCNCVIIITCEEIKKKSTRAKSEAG